MLALALLLTGCAAGSVDNDEPPNANRASLDDAPERWQAIAGERLLPLEARVTRFRVVAGPDEGETLTQRLAVDEDGQWTLTVEGRQRTYLHRDEHGALRFDREDDFEQNVAVHYDPPLVLLPAEIDPDTTGHHQEVDVVVRHLDTGGVRERGTSEYRITQVRLSEAEEREGPEPETEQAAHASPVYTITQQRELNLRFASASVTIETEYVPDFGRIAWAVERHTRALGLIGSRRSERYERLPETDADGADAAPDGAE